MGKTFCQKTKWILLGVYLLAGVLRTSAAQLATFSAGNGGWHMGAIAVGNIDADAQQEIIISYRDLPGQWHLDAFKWNGTHIAGFPYNSGLDEMNTSPTLYDLDGDGKMEIIFMRGASIIALRGNGSLVWSNTVTYQNYVPHSGFQTVTNGFYWSSDSQFHPTLPANTVFSSQFSSPIVADFDGNGTKKIATAWKIRPDPNGVNQDFNPFINNIWGFGEWGTVGESWSGGVVFFNAQTGAKDFVYHIHTLVEAGLGVGQADTDNPLEVYVLNDSDSVVAFDKTKPFGFYGNGQLHKMFGKNLRVTTGFYKQAIDVYPADIDGDGLDELLSVTTQYNCLWQPSESMLDDDGALMWRKWKPSIDIVNNNGWFNNAAMVPVNPDHDNRVDVLSYTHGFEIFFREWDGINFVDHAGWPKNFAPFMPTPPVVGDVDGDGQEEIIIGTCDPTVVPSSGSLYIYALNGTLKQSLAVPGGIKHIPFLADVNGDGSLDVTYRSLAGQVYVQNFGATSATNVSWATHRGNAQRDGYRGRSLYPPNTPLITKKMGGTGKAYFEWSGTNASEFRLYRAPDAAGAFNLITSIPASVTNYTDYGLAPGWQYFYELAAVVNGNEVRSAPFAIVSLLNSNLVANGAFEENDNSHWDKWDTGDISWTNIIGSTNALHGRQSMKIVYQNNTTTDSINQYAMYGTPRAYIPVTAGTLYSFGGFIKNGAMNVATKHWFEWTSSLTGENYSPRPSFPYPNYFTPEMDFSTSASGWIYLNRVFTMPAGFPNVELRHRFSTTSPANGTIYLDDLFFRPLPPANHPQWKNLVPFGSSWRYLMIAPPANWYATNFNDLTWLSGNAKFGAGSSPTNVATPLLPAQPAYYFRKTFNLAAENYEEFILAATCTDDYGGTIYPMRLWLNGLEVSTSGIEAVSFEGNEIKYFDLTPFRTWLKAGANTIAVQINNTWQLTWDNVAFDVSLKAITALDDPAQIVFIRRNPTTVDLQISAQVGSAVRIESRDSFNAPWQVMQSLSSVSTNLFWITDTGQNGRLPPAQAPIRYYRARMF